MILPNKQKSPSGFTLTEIMVSSLIGVIILSVVFSCLNSGVKGYKTVVNGATEIATFSSTQDIILSDLERINLHLPISLGSGTDDTGWDIAGDSFLEWDQPISFGSNFPSEKNKGFPNDRLGFFITLPPEHTSQYEGKNIAHILYFTAVTSDYMVEKLVLENTGSLLGYSRKLYRYFTPPDRVYERLNMLNPTSEHWDKKGIYAIPRGPIITPNGATDDDHGWYSHETNISVLSVVSCDIAQFKVTLKGKIQDSVTLTPQKIVNDFSSGVMGLSQSSKDISLHHLLQAESKKTTNSFSPTHLSFSIKACLPSVARTLTINDWDKATGPKQDFLGRPNNKPLTVTFSKRIAE